MTNDDYIKLKSLFSEKNPYVLALILNEDHSINEEKSLKKINWYINKYIKLSENPKIKSFFNEGEANKVFYLKALGFVHHWVKEAKNYDLLKTVMPFLKQQRKFIEEQLEKNGLLNSYNKMQDVELADPIERPSSFPDFVTSDGYLVKGFTPSAYVYTAGAKENYEATHGKTWNSLLFSPKNARKNWETGTYIPKSTLKEQTVVKTWIRDEKSWTVGSFDSCEKLFASMSGSPYVLKKFKNGYRLLDLRSPAPNKAIHTYTNKYTAANDFINLSWEYFKKDLGLSSEYYFYKAKKEAVELIFDDMVHDKTPYTKDDYKEWVTALKQNSVFHLSMETYSNYRDKIKEIAFSKFPGAKALNKEHCEVADKVGKNSLYRDPTPNLLFLKEVREDYNKARAKYNQHKEKQLERILYNKFAYEDKKINKTLTR